MPKLKIALLYQGFLRWDELEGKGCNVWMLRVLQVQRP